MSIDLSPIMVMIVIFIAFFILLMSGHPLVFTLGGLAVIFGFLFWGDLGVLRLFMRTLYNITTNIAYVATPLFIFMGAILERSGSADRLFDSMYIILGKLRGGLGIATTVICALLAAATGIIGASITIMTMLALPAMLKHGYNQNLATGTVMAAGCLGTIIPPSIILIIYGAIAQVSISRLFAGGVGAGITLALLYIVYIAIRTLINPKLGPAIAKEETEKYSGKDKLGLLISSVTPPIVLIVVVLGTIFLGIATPTEAAAMGCLGAMVVAAIYKKLNWHVIKESCFVTMKTTATIMWIIVAASMFTSVFLGLGGREIITNMVLGLELDRWVILTIILFIVFIMGMIVDVYGVLLICIPIFTPIVYALDFNPIWFGIMFAVMIQASYMSPPFAYAVFYLRAIAPPEIRTGSIYVSALPFLGLIVIASVVLSIFPEIIMWLPLRM